MNQNDLKQYLKTKRARVEAYLASVFDGRGEPFEKLKSAMLYSLLDGGKRIRPILAMACAEAVGGVGEIALPFGCAIELVHSFSLIHDDLPAMDNDDLRRGKPTNHKVFGEDHAILAGDALLSEAFGLIARQASIGVVESRVALDIVARLSWAAGLDGMVGGQSLDLLHEHEQADLETLQIIHHHKTAALISAACYAGARAGGGDKDRCEILSEYGRLIGLAFQAADDLLNVTGDPKDLGKAVGSDKERGKATYPSLLGLEEAKKMALQMRDDAIMLLDDFPEGRTWPLVELARYIVERDR